MDKLIGWTFLIIGIIFLLPLFGLKFIGPIGDWIVSFGFLIVGILKLIQK